LALSRHRTELAQLGAKGAKGKRSLGRATSTLDVAAEAGLADPENLDRFRIQQLNVQLHQMRTSFISNRKILSLYEEQPEEDLEKFAGLIK